MLSAYPSGSSYTCLLGLAEIHCSLTPTSLVLLPLYCPCAFLFPERLDCIHVQSPSLSLVSMAYSGPTAHQDLLPTGASPSFQGHITGPRMEASWGQGSCQGLKLLRGFRVLSLNSLDLRRCLPACKEKQGDREWPKTKEEKSCDNFPFREPFHRRPCKSAHAC